MFNSCDDIINFSDFPYPYLSALPIFNKLSASPVQSMYYMTKMSK